MKPPDAPWQREARRLHLRYLVEVVEACGLCPWAEGTRRQDRMAMEILLHVDDAAFGSAIGAIDTWIADPRIDIGFLIFPHLPLGRLEFDHFVERLRKAEAGRRPPGEVPFALAAFHPDAAPDLHDAERLIPFLRRTPDPCIQAVRMSALDRVRGGAAEGTQFVDVASIDFAAVPSNNADRPLRERIARANLHTIQRMGVEHFAERVEDIRRDRDRTYAALDWHGI